MIITVGVLVSLLGGSAPADGVQEPGEVAARFQGELEMVYRAWVLCPGEMLSVFDNMSDLEDCKARTGADATVGFSDLTHVLKASESGETPCLMPKYIETLRAAGASGQFFLGERNNPYFTYYAEDFRGKHPEAFMRDSGGALIEVTSNPIANVRNPVPAVDDPVLMRLAGELIRREVNAAGAEPLVRGWFIGSEEAWPDYFGLPVGDFRPASIEHYKAFAPLRGLPLPCDPARIVAEEGGPAAAAWFAFREQAMADRARSHMRAFLAADSARPVLYPTHGHPFSGDMRKKLGQPPALLAGACDGFEMGHIVINDDNEGLNLLYLASFTAFGVPVAAPRLGNKTLDPAARGGGRSFTPRMLRRLVYECLGMGVWHIGPIHWRAILGDGEWAIKDTPAEAECAAVFAEIKRARPVLAGMSRLQPAVGLYVSDDTWLDEWNPRWTAFLQDAFAAHWNVTLVNDALVDAGLADRIPALVSIENTRLSEGARRGLASYVAAGGRLYAWGGLGTEDFLGRRSAPLTLEGDRFVRLDCPLETEARTITNQFQTGDGAWQRVLTTRAVPLKDVEAALLVPVPARLVRPLVVDAPRPEALEVFTLTDGASLATVVINRSAAAVDAVLRAAEGLLPAGAPWAVKDALEPAEDLMRPDGSFVAHLGPYGTATFWIHPVMEPDVACRMVADAEAALDRWKERGADCAAVVPLLEQARASAAVPERAAKAASLAAVITSSCCLKAEAEPCDGGGLRVRARVYDSNGRPVDGARVRMRIVPGDFLYHVLEPETPGVYGVTLPQDRAPLAYDFDTRRYGPLTGPARLVVTARTPGSVGGAMFVKELP